MNTPALSATESDALGVLRAFLLGILADGTEVIRGLDNRVPEPVGADFVVMTPILRERIETNVSTYRDGWPDAPSVREVRQPIKLTVQLDVHGPSGGDNVQVISTLFRDTYAADYFAASGVANGFEMAPLYSGEPRQMPFLNGEQQVESRWSVDCVLQINARVTVPQDFTPSLEIGTAGHPVTARTRTVQPWNGLVEVDSLTRQ